MSTPDELDLNEYDEVLLACRPVEWSERTLGSAASTPETLIYTDSVVKLCETCQNQIYVGPRAQQMIAAGVPHRLVCFLCSFRLSGGQLDEKDVRHLRNPEGDV